MRRSSSRPGHQANVGTLGTLLDAGDTVIVDSADHASILDGVLLSRAKMRPFRHNRMDKLERALARAEEDGGGVLVVVDGVFSMEGDIAPLVDIAELCSRHGARLMVDEAHGAGVLGARGAGAAELLGVEDGVDLRMGTFSKSLAACGGFVAGPAEVIDYLRISSRAFLFTASAVPAALGAALAALRIVRSSEGPQLLAEVLEHASYFAEGLDDLGFSVLSAEPVRLGPGEDAPRGTVRTPIIPVMVGDDWKAALLWRALYDGGVFTNCALHPAVPPAGALLRTSVMAHARPAHARPGSRRVRAGQARIRGRAWAPSGTRRRLIGQGRPASGTCPFLHKSGGRGKRSLLAWEALSTLLTARPGLP